MVVQVEQNRANQCAIFNNVVLFFEQGIPMVGVLMPSIKQEILKIDRFILLHDIRNICIIFAYFLPLMNK